MHVRYDLSATLTVVLAPVLKDGHECWSVQYWSREKRAAFDAAYFPLDMLGDAHDELNRRICAHRNACRAAAVVA